MRSIVLKRLKSRGKARRPRGVQIRLLQRGAHANQLSAEAELAVGGTVKAGGNSGGESGDAPRGDGVGRGHGPLQGVDGGGAAEGVSGDNWGGAVEQGGLGERGEDFGGGGRRPGADGVAGLLDKEVLRRGARGCAFQEEYGGIGEGRAETGGEDAARGACAYDDYVWRMVAKCRRKEGEKGEKKDGVVVPHFFYFDVAVCGRGEESKESKESKERGLRAFERDGEVLGCVCVCGIVMDI